MNLGPARVSLWTVLVIACLAAGCAPDLNTWYGRRTGYFANSVNGTAVLGDMFVEAGHSVRSWHVLSPSLQEADVIVWAPDDFEPPRPDVQMWFNEWLQYNDQEKVLIYIGRDYNAEPHYWQTVLPQAPANQQAEYRRRLASAKSEAVAERASIPTKGESPGWFTIDGTTPLAKVRSLQGPFAKGVNAAQVDIEHHSRIRPAGKAEVLLATGKAEPLVSEIRYEGYSYGQQESRLVIVENGSFLLNVPLVNKEHRKLAGKLIAHVGRSPKRVVFLESMAGGPEIRETEPTGGPPTGFGLFGVWPLGPMLAQLAAVGIVFAFMRWPIFGVARRLRGESLTDFSKHVEAIGKLVGETRDRSYATAALRSYHQLVNRESREALRR